MNFISFTSAIHSQQFFGLDHMFPFSISLVRRLLETYPACVVYRNVSVKQTATDCVWMWPWRRKSRLGGFSVSCYALPCKKGGHHAQVLILKWNGQWTANRQLRPISICLYWQSCTHFTVSSRWSCLPGSWRYRSETEAATEEDTLEWCEGRCK